MKLNSAKSVPTEQSVKTTEIVGIIENSGAFNGFDVKIKTILKVVEKRKPTDESEITGCVFPKIT